MRSPIRTLSTHITYAAEGCVFVSVDYCVEHCSVASNIKESCAELEDGTLMKDSKPMSDEL